MSAITGFHMAEKLPFVSVIIPTYHDWDRLKFCIAELQNQTYPKDHFEVIVVNNDPRDVPSQLLLPENFKLLIEEKPGSYAARNTGILKSKGEIIAFIDSDCIPSVDWIKNAVCHFQKGVQRIAGKINLIYHSHRLTLVEKYEKVYAFRQKEYAIKGVSVTANMITRRQHFQKTGLFDERFLSGGDIEWGFRASSSGIPIIYAHDVTVQHPARRHVRDLLKKRKRVAGGEILINKPMGGLKFIIWICTGFMPPLDAFIKIRRRLDLTFEEKIYLLALHYLIKIYSTCQKLIALSNIREPKRD